jgi:hypothetical protein
MRGATRVALTKLEARLTAGLLFAEFVWDIRMSARFGGRPFAILVAAIAGGAHFSEFRDDLEGRTANRSWLDPGLHRSGSSSH